MATPEQGREPLTYAATGPNYELMDPFKRAAIHAASSTAGNLATYFAMQEIAASRGESAYVWDEGHKYCAMVIEGLGTKNLVADAMRKISGRTHYDTVAQDALAMIVNDLIVVGAMPKVITAHFSVADAEWFSDMERANDLLTGYAAAANLSGATWGGGETPTLKDILLPGVMELSGSAVGDIFPKDRLVLGDKLQADDRIIAIESSGIHANGLTLAREVADKLPKGYATELSDGRMYGEALLTPTHIYVAAVRKLLENKVDIHYMSNLTGHGWRKVMRADKELTYRITDLPTPQPEFELIQRVSNNDDEEMYGNFNMGAGFAVYVPPEAADETIALIKSTKLKAWDAGSVKEGPKKVILESKGLTFEPESLQVR